MNDKPKSAVIGAATAPAAASAATPDAKDAAADEKQARVGAVISAARNLREGWTASAFYDRQDPVDAEALIDALDQLKKGDA